MNKSAVDWLLARDYATLCPVCGYNLGAPAWAGPTSSSRTCPSCGIMFGVDDDSAAVIHYLQWRDGWIDRHMPWWDARTPVPTGWDPVVQFAASVRISAR